MADEAKLIAIVEANTRQIESAMKRLVPIIKGSTDQMSASVKKLDTSVIGLGKNASSLAGKFAKGFGLGFGATKIVQMIVQVIKMNDELREQGLISKETFEQVDELGRAWGRASAAMQGAAAQGVSVLSESLTVAGNATTLFLQDVELLLRALQRLKEGKWSEGLDLLNKGIASAAAAADRISGAFEATGGTAGGRGTGSRETAARLLMDVEGFRSEPYWDTDRLRIGYGSSTTTKSSGVFGAPDIIANVTAASRVTEAEAMRDLQRRIAEFEDVVVSQIGEDIFKALTPGAQAALTSVAYNMGHLPPGLAKAAKTLDINAISGAILAIPSNPSRRLKEAATAAGDTPLGDTLEKKIEEQKKAVEEAAKKSKEEEEKALKKLNELEEERNQLIFERALKAGEVTDDMKRQADAINESMAFNRDLVGGFIKDLEHGVKPAEALANAIGKIADRLLDLALEQIFPDVVAGAVGSAGGGIFGSIFGHAGGGVMTGRGPMPLRKYAGGGVAHSPQVALFGEGGRPEAYVPLPDGRRIPVNLRVPGMGGLGGGQARQGFDVHVHSEPSPLLITHTAVVARQAGRDAVVEVSDGARRRPGGR